MGGQEFRCKFMNFTDIRQFEIRENALTKSLENWEFPHAPVLDQKSDGVCNPEIENTFFFECIPIYIYRFFDAYFQTFLTVFHYFLMLIE